MDKETMSMNEKDRELDIYETFSKQKKRLTR